MLGVLTLLCVMLFGMTAQASSYGGVTGAGGCVIKYVDGCDGAVFPDQTYEAAEGDPTPGADSLHPSRSGYKFIGWYPKPLQKVESDQTYTAQWQKDASASGSEAAVTQESSSEQAGQTVSSGQTVPTVSQDAKGDQSVPDVDTWDVDLGMVIAICGVCIVAFFATIGFGVYRKYRSV